METTKTKYANALFSIALEANKVKEYQSEAKEILAILSKNEDFIKVLDCSFLPILDRVSEIDKVFKGQVSEDILSFLKVVVQNNRASYLMEILREFSSECNDNLSIMEGIIYSTEKLTVKQIKSIETTIAKLENKKVELHNKISPSLLGGIKVVINDHVYDGSLSSKLEGLRKVLLK